MSENADENRSRSRRASNLGRHALRLAVVLAALSLIAACSGPADKFEVAGNVTLDGVPLDRGGIRFSSEGEKLFTTGAMIRDGRYKIPAEKGLPAGVYKISISSADEKAPKLVIDGTALPPDRIPAEYNVKSDVTIEVTAKGTNEFPFDITTTKTK